MQLSRSEQKRRIKELEKLIVELAELSGQVIAKAPCPPEVKELLKECRQLKGGAKKRQLKYITKLLKAEPVDELYTYLSKRKGSVLKDKKQFHEIEYFRDTLLNEAIARLRECQESNQEMGELWQSSTVQQIKMQYAGIDPATLSRLSYLFARTRNTKHSREIFRYLRSVQEQQQFAKKSQG